MSIRVDIVSDVVCPWCVIGHLQLARASRETGVDIELHWHPFELNPDLPPEGENLREHLAAKYGTTPEGSRAARARLTKLGAELGFAFAYSDDMRMVNTRRAHQLIDWAQEHRLGHEASTALMRAFFARREDLHDPAVLAKVAAEVGLDPAAAYEMLEEGSRAETVRAKERFWTERGITGVPAMIFEKRHLVSGAQGEAVYADILRRLSAEAA